MPSIDLTQTHLVTAQWLNEHLDDTDLRILDATVAFDPETTVASSGYANWETAHIPGSQHVDVIAELSDPSADAGLPDGQHRYQLPTPEAFAAAVSARGINNDTPVVVYDCAGGPWAARVWWMLRVFGHENVAVLDGGWAAWQRSGGSIESGPSNIAAAGDFTSNYRPELVADKARVKQASDSQDAVLVHSLTPELFAGVGPTPYPRPGRIPGSINVFFATALNADGTLADETTLRDVFGSQGITGEEPVITYCGGGIAATVNSLALATLGIESAVYDGSLTEWAGDAALDMEVG